MNKLYKMLLTGMVVFAFALFLYGAAGAAVSPVGDQTDRTWDFAVSGAVIGATYLTFYDDFTVEGYMVVAGKKFDTGTTGSVGSFYLIGEWSMNEKGQVVGYLENDDPADTVRMDITSFVGEVSSQGTAFSFTGETAFGRIRFAGIPASALTSLVDAPFTTDWKLTLTKSVSRQSFAELVVALEVLPNFYYFEGRNSDLCVVGVALLSQGTNISIALGDVELPASGNCADADTDSDNLALSVAVGTINLSTGIALLKGAEEGSLTNKVTMKLETKNTPAGPEILPVGTGAEKTWDFAVSGAVKGATYLTFHDDFTIDGYMIVSGDKYKIGTTGSTGTFMLSGQWWMDSMGQVVGYLENDDPEDTVRMDITRFVGKVSSQNTIFSFTGETAFGRIRFAGIPASALTSLVDAPFTTDWKLTLIKSVSQQSFVDLVVASQVLPNFYSFEGRNSDVCVFGTALLSQGSNIVISVGDIELPDSGNCADADSDPDSLALSAAVGTINLSTGIASLNGSEEGSLVNKVKMMLELK